MNYYQTKEYIKKAAEDEDFYSFDDKGNETDEIYLDGDGVPFRPDAIVVDGVTVLYIARQLVPIKRSNWNGKRSCH